MHAWKRSLGLAVVVSLSLIMVFALTGIAYAGSGTGGGDGKAVKTVCVEGIVLNHRELPVDGTKTAPPLSVDATSGGQTVSADVDEDGHFQFDDLAAGDWNFMMQLPPEWEGIVPIAEAGGLAETGPTALKEKDEGCYKILFKIRRIFNISVLKWEEQLDGTVIPGVDWEIKAIPVGDPYAVAQEDTTGSGGGTSFALTPGTWIIRETVKSGWLPVTPPAVEIHLDQYAAPGARDPVIFKNREGACKSKIVVEKFGFGRDAKGADLELGPLAGWKVAVSRADGAWGPWIKFTDGFGRAEFDGLRPGVYKVKEYVQPGWEVIGDDVVTVIHKDCETTTVTFKNRETKGQLTIDGYKYLKAWVGPAKHELVGLSGWVITATLLGTDYEVSTVTNALGKFIFTEEMLSQAGIGFPGATVRVCEESRDHWIHVTPECVDVMFPYPVPPDFMGETIKFINVQDPPAAGPATAATNAACRTVHIVKRGQTLARIAAYYGTSVGALSRANSIRNINLLYTGQKLCVP